MPEIIKVTASDSSVTYSPSVSIAPGEDPEGRAGQEVDESTIKNLTKAVQYCMDKRTQRGVRLRPLEEIMAVVLSEFTVLDINEQYFLIVGQVQEWYSEDPALMEQLLYRYRKGPDGMETIARVLRDYASKCGARVIHSGTMAHDNHEALARLYQQQGFRMDYIGLIDVQE